MTVARIRRVLMLAIAILIFLTLAGATYQGVATALERRRFPYPGRMVDVGGHQLHIYCVGEGSPTVVLEAPAAAMSAAWGAVQPVLAQSTRVCSYDRAGLGWSEAGDGGFAPLTAAAQLKTLIERSGERPPFILAGHGLGAALAILEAEQLTGDVVALALIDQPLDPGEEPSDYQRVQISPWLARAGVLRLSGTLSDRVGGLPEPSARALSAFLNRPDHLTRASMELEQWRELLRLSAAAQLPASLRIVRINAMGDTPMAFLSTGAAASRVIAGVRDIVDATRRKL